MTLFFERPEFGERAILVHLKLQSESEPEDPREFEELVLSAGGDPVEFITGSRSAPHAKLFVGTGKLEEIAAAVQSHCAELVIFNHNLSPSQERNIEAELKCRVLDRTGLILDIFAQRARTHEGKLQVELAQLQHLSSRLVRGWTHLERQTRRHWYARSRVKLSWNLIGVWFEIASNRLQGRLVKGAKAACSGTSCQSPSRGPCSFISGLYQRGQVDVV